MNIILKHTLAACLTLGSALTLAPACVSAHCSSPAPSPTPVQGIVIDADDTTIAGWWLRAAQDLDKVALNTANANVLPAIQAAAITDAQTTGQAVAAAYLVNFQTNPQYANWLASLTTAATNFFQAGTNYLSNAGTLNDWILAGNAFGTQLASISQQAIGINANTPFAIATASNLLINFINTAAALFSDYNLQNNATAINDESALTQLGYQFGVFTSIYFFNN